MPNPTQQLDFARFSSDALLDYHRAERDVLRRHSTVPVTTNFMISAHQSEQDYFAWAPDVDVVSQDHYLDHRLPHPRAEQAFADDLTRGVAGGGPWLLMETATSRGELAAGERRQAARASCSRDSLRHVARGADGVGFFQWRASRAGGEKFHSAMVPHAGPDIGVVPRGGRARRGAEGARRGGGHAGRGRRRAALGLELLVGL